MPKLTDLIKPEGAVNLTAEQRFIDLCKVISEMTGEYNPHIDVSPSGNLYR